MSPLLIVSIYCVLIVLASLAGGWLPNWIKLTHMRLQIIMSFVAGLMLGVAVLQLLPHSIEETGAVKDSCFFMMIGLLTMFFMIRAFHFHNHGPIEPLQGDEADQHDHDHDAVAHQHGEHVHCQDHVHHHSHADATGKHQFSWTGVFLGLAIHTAIDGMALAAIVESAAKWNVNSSMVGLGVFLAILLHKPLDALSITSVMIAGGWSVRARQIVNLSFALMCPLGAMIFFLGVSQFTGMQHWIVGAALGFSAGVFLCISLGDLLPELHFHGHDRVTLSIALVLGIALAYGIEQSHVHAPPQPRAPLKIDLSP